jgi:glycosyltransferase involved in cell wall biosynthesis
VPIRVTHLINSLGQGGAERLLLDLDDHWDRDRLDVRVIALMDAAAPIISRADLPPGWRVVGLRGPWDPLGWRRARQALDAAPIDILHTHLMLADVLGRRTAQRRGLPVLTTLHSPAQHYLGPPERRPSLLQSAYERVARATPGLWVGCSEQVARSFHDHPRWSADVMVVDNGLDPSRMTLDPRAAAALRQELGLREGQILLVTVARLVPSKGHRVLIEALTGMKGLDAVACWVGDGPLRAGLERRAREIGLWDHLRVAGSRQDVTPYLAAADVFVLPSLHEGMPMALLEALAAGLPVVTTEASGIGEEIARAGAGLVVNSGDSEALRAAIRTMAGSPDLRQAAGERAAALFHERYHAERCAAQYERIYEALAAGGRTERR